MEVLRQVVERIARITEARSLIVQGALRVTSERSDPMSGAFQCRYAVAGEDLHWQVTSRYGQQERRFIDVVEFLLASGWRCAVGESRTVAMYERFQGAWRPWIERRPPWQIRPTGDDAVVIDASYQDTLAYRVHHGEYTLEYRQADDGLRLARVALREGCRAPLVPLMPEVANLDPALATQEGREAYERAAREWSERYLAACRAWSGNFADVPTLLPLDGDAYVQGTRRIPTKLFGFDGLMALLLGRLDALAAQLPPTEQPATVAR